MKALWIVSFRPIGKSRSNDFIQNMFVESVKSLGTDVHFSLTQFDEENVREFVEQKKIKNHYINIPKNELPDGKKYSNHLMLKNALNQYIENDYQYLICSSADIIVPNNFFKTMSINFGNYSFGRSFECFDYTVGVLIQQFPYTA